MVPNSEPAPIIGLPGEPYEPDITFYNFLRHYKISGSIPGTSIVRVKALRVPDSFPEKRCLGELYEFLGDMLRFIRNHRHIARMDFYKASECSLSPEPTPFPTVLVMREYEGNILEYIGKHDGNVSVPQRTRWLLQAADALHFLHSVYIIHGNVYFGNILIDSEGHAVVADARIYTAITNLVPDDIVARRLRFPNSLTSKSARAVHNKGLRWEDASVSEDTFSFAVTAWTVYSGQEPFAMHEHTARTVSQIGAGAHRHLPKAIGMSDNLWKSISMIFGQRVMSSEWPSLKDIISELENDDIL